MRECKGTHGYFLAETDIQAKEICGMIKEN